MPSKEEIEKMRNTFEYRDIERLKNLCVNKSVQRFEFNDLIALDNLIKDYEILETKEQKLIEKLEADKMKNNEFEFMPLQIEQAYNNYYKLGKIDEIDEILEILKGENDEYINR